MRIGNESITVNHTIETEGGKLPAPSGAAAFPLLSFYHFPMLLLRWPEHSLNHMTVTHPDSRSTQPTYWKSSVDDEKPEMPLSPSRLLDGPACLSVCLFDWPA